MLLPIALLTEGEQLGVNISIAALIVAIIGVLIGIVIARYYYKKSTKETNTKFSNQESQINLLGRKLSDLEPENAEMIKDEKTGEYTHLAKSRAIAPEFTTISDSVSAVVTRGTGLPKPKTDEQNTSALEEPKK